MTSDLPEQSVNGRISGNTQIRGSRVARSGAATGRRRSSTHHADEVFSSLVESHDAYQWQKHAPKGVLKFLKWLVTGFSHGVALAPEDDSKEKMSNLARTLTLLRMYEAKWGMPNGGSKKEQEWVLEELCKRLYASGVPVWVLQPVLSISATGLTGRSGFDFFLLPASGIIIPPQGAAGYSTHFYQMNGSFCMYRLNMYEKVLARLSSFSTNTRTINSVPDESLPKLLMQDVHHLDELENESLRDKEAVVKNILDLASRGYGLFFLTQVEEIMTQQQEERLNEDDESVGGLASDGEASIFSYHSFWNVEESIRELFTRLACIEAAECLDAIERSPGLDDVWPRRYVVLFRIFSSAGSSALWFNGSWQDMLLAGGLAGMVAFLFQTSSFHFLKNQRVIFEVVCGFVVGLSSGLVTIKLPSPTCFSAIAVASMIDYLRGFGIVFSIMEVMSKNTMSGSADLIEALVFSFLISMSMLFGLRAAEGIMGIDDSPDDSDPDGYMNCGQPIAPTLWFLLILPIASIGWAASFKPAYCDLPLMTFHGILSFIVSWAVEQASGESFFGSFIAALTVSTVAGLVSRFTGRQALGDTLTGLYALVPGIYITESFFAGAIQEDFEEASTFMLKLVLKAVIIGVGSVSL